MLLRYKLRAAITTGTTASQLFVYKIYTWFNGEPVYVPRPPGVRSLVAELPGALVKVGGERLNS
eukprot:6700838-Karenia_brevis.AAC.1